MIPELLAQTPTKAAFQQAWTAFAKLRQPLSEDVLLSIRERLGAWPDEVCTEPDTWLDDIDTPARHLVRSLHLTGPYCTPLSLAHFQAVTRVADQLRDLSITQLDPEHADACLEILVNTPFPRLRRLRLNGVPEAAGPLALAEFPALRSLGFGAELSAAGWSALFEARWFSGVEHLKLRGPPARALPPAPNLRRLDLPRSWLGSALLTDLVESALHLEQLTLEPDDAQPTLSDQEKLALHGAAWIHDQPRREIEAACPAFFFTHVHRLRAQAVATGLAARNERDFGVVFRELCWVHADHRDVLLKQLAPIDDWSPGPLACMQVGPFDDTVSDRLSGMIEDLLPLLSASLLDEDDSLAPWLDQVEPLRTLEPGRAPPPAFESWEASRPESSVPDHVLHGLIRTVRWCTIREHYVEWKRQTHFVATVEALLTWRASQREHRCDLRYEDLRTAFDSKLARRLLQTAGNDWWAAEGPSSRRFHSR